MNETHSAPTNTRSKGLKRARRTIRFFDPEWERVEAFAETRGIAAAEFVRFATLAAIADDGNSLARLTPLVEATFRGTYMLATRMRDQMLGAGEQNDLDSLIVKARELQDILQDNVSA